jgi:single-strand DNA-binding protein
MKARSKAVRQFALEKNGTHDMSTNTITITGNVTAQPELRFLPSGLAVASFTVADTPRYQDKDSGEWKDGEALFQRVSVRGELAENVGESLTRGTYVTVTGRLHQRTYTPDGGEKRTLTEIRAEDVAVSLKFATAVVTKNTRKTA